MLCAALSRRGSALAHRDRGYDEGLAYLRDDMNWMRVFSEPRVDLTPALFLDRDGVIIEERGYLSSHDGVTLIDGAAERIAERRSAGQAVVVITNQSGIGRGLLDWGAYRRIEDRMLELLAAAGATVDLILACPFHPDGGRPPYNRDDAWRKPAAGMLFQARDQLNLDLARSQLVGDRSSDIEAAKTAGIPKAFHVATGHGKRERQAALALSGPDFEVFELASIADLSC